MTAERVPAIVVMGVSGSGKSTVGRLLAERLRGTFVDADDLHPVENVAKMTAGQPLTDDDRWPWLDRVGDVLAGSRSERPVVVACSALRRSYRDVLRRTVPRIVFLHLAGDTALLMQRMAVRVDHFMPAALLDSQLRTLEPLQPNEEGLVLDFSLHPTELASLAVGQLGARGATAGTGT